MKVFELSEMWQTYPSDIRDVVNDYEEGYDDIDRDLISVTKIKLNTKTALYMGMHADVYDKREQNSNIAEALVFNRSSN